MLFPFAFLNTHSKAGRSTFVTLLCLSFTFPLTLCLNMWFLFLTILHFVRAFLEIGSCLQCFLQVQGFDIWDREEWQCLHSTFKEIWWFQHLKCKAFCSILILKFRYEMHTLLGSGHLVHCISVYLETERWPVRDAWFSLWCYICTLSLALSLCLAFFPFHPPREQQCDILWELCAGARLTVIETTETEKYTFLLTEARMGRKHVNKQTKKKSH